MSSPGGARRRRLPLGRTTRTLAAATLGTEAVAVVFALPVAATLGGLTPALALGLGIPLVVACGVVAGLLRHRWAYPVASVLQLVVLGAGTLVPGLWFIGGVFALLWVLALVYGTRADRMVARAGGSEPG